MDTDQFATDLLELENVLVRQFRALQNLIQLTRRERERLLNGTGQEVLLLTEEKEALLDQISLMEDQRRSLVQSLTLAAKLHSENTSIAELLPVLPELNRQRVGHLADGINTLANQARELSHGNQALACSKMDWMKALQSFIVNTVHSEAGYCPQGSAPAVWNSVALGFDYRA